MNISRIARKLTIASISLLVLNMTGKAQATIVNSSFETRDLTGWFAIGSSRIETAAFGSGATEGSFEVLLDTGFGSTIDSNIERFLSLPTGTLDLLSSSDATEGSAIRQSFTARAGDIVSFDWNFLTNEFTPTFFNDFAFVSLNGSLNSTELLADTFSPFTSSLTPFVEETGFNTFSWEIPVSGSYTLGIGVLDVGDTVVNSGLLVDNISIKKTPEPASILGLIVLGSLGTTALKRKKSS